MEISKAVNSLVPIFFGLEGSIPDTGVEVLFLCFVHASVDRLRVSPVLVDSLLAGGFVMAIPGPFMVTGPYRKFRCGAYIVRRHCLRDSCAITPLFLDLKKKEILHIACLLPREESRQVEGRARRREKTV